MPTFTAAYQRQFTALHNIFNDLTVTVFHFLAGAGQHRKTCKCAKKKERKKERKEERKKEVGGGGVLPLANCLRTVRVNPMFDKKQQQKRHQQ